jgi:hypothetical protein
VRIPKPLLEQAGLQDDVEPKAIRILREALAKEGLAFESGQA